MRRIQCSCRAISTASYYFPRIGCTSSDEFIVSPWVCLISRRMSWNKALIQRAHPQLTCAQKAAWLVRKVHWYCSPSLSHQCRKAMALGTIIMAINHNMEMNEGMNKGIWMRGLALMMSAKFPDFLTPIPPCPHLDLIYLTPLSGEARTR